MNTRAQKSWSTLLLLQYNITNPCQGIFKGLKAHYRTNLTRQLIIAINNGETTAEYGKSSSVLKAISNCFRKAGFGCEGNEVMEMKSEEIASHSREFENALQIASLNISSMSMKMCNEFK